MRITMFTNMAMLGLLAQVNALQINSEYCQGEAAALNNANNEKAKLLKECPCYQRVLDAYDHLERCTKAKEECFKVNNVKDQSKDTNKPKSLVSSTPA